VTTGLVEPPATERARQARDLVHASCPAHVAAHCERSFQFAALLARYEQIDVDLEVLYVGTVLHDLGLSGYHAIWVSAAQTIWVPLSYGPPEVMLAGLPLAAVGLWLLFWPGNRGPNRFGEKPG